LFIKYTMLFHNLPAKSKMAAFKRNGCHKKLHCCISPWGINKHLFSSFNGVLQSLQTNPCVSLVQQTMTSCMRLVFHWSSALKMNNYIRNRSSRNIQGVCQCCSIIYRQNSRWRHSSVTGVTINYTVVFHPGE
jgi:hypothetical protein